MDKDLFDEHNFSGVNDKPEAGSEDLRLAIRRELLAIFNHPLTSDAFKSNPIILEWIK